MRAASPTATTAGVDGGASLAWRSASSPDLQPNAVKSTITALLIKIWLKRLFIVECMHDTRAGLCCVSTDEEKAIPAKISAHPQEAVHRCPGPKHPSGNTVHRHGSNLPDAGRRFLWSHMHAH